MCVNPIFGNRDHPRSRGEYHPCILAHPRGQGSSPLSRGIHWGWPRGASLRRIIPALAGNTDPTRTPPTPSPDHPRSRGEYPSRWFPGRVWSGSSPLSRGIPDAVVVTTQPVRIIPALAGNTWAYDRSWNVRRDHPRSRGEYAKVEGLFARENGSSPLSRGIPRTCAAGGRPGRIIPALAGNTPCPNSALHPRTDHPRSRGEYYWQSPVP